MGNAALPKAETPPSYGIIESVDTVTDVVLHAMAGAPIPDFGS